MIIVSKDWANEEKYAFMEIGIFIVLIALLLAYLLFIKAVSYIAKSRLFKPQTPTYSDKTADILKLPLPNGQHISALYLPNPLAHFTLLLSHGNMADIGLCLPLVEQIYREGFSVMVYDYPGYGTSDGKPSEQGIYAAIDAAYAFLTQERHIPPHRIIAYGRSLGGGPTMDLAIRKPLAGIIVECTFTSVFRIKFHYGFIPFDLFKNIDKAKKLSIPALVIHGELDEIVPFWHGQRLFENIRSPKKHLWVPHAGHSDVMEVAYQDFWRTVHEFCQECRLSS